MDAQRPIEELLAEYLASNLRIRSDSTQRHYGIFLNHLGRFLGRRPVVGDLTDATVSAFARWLLNGRSPATVNQRLQYCRAFAKWCCQRGYLFPWLTVSDMPAGRPAPRAWTKEELAALVDACRAQRGNFHGVPKRLWWEAFHRVAWDTGERCSPLLALRWGWLNRRTGVLEVPAEARKGKVKPAVYTLKRPTLNMLREIRTYQREKELFVFGAWHKATFYYRYGKLLEAAGLPNNRYTKPQKLRRTFATWLEQAGGDATKALQHSRRSVTDEHYIDKSIAGGPPPNKLLFDLEGLAG